MISNGFIQPKTTSNGGIDDDGMPVKASSGYGTEIKCRVQKNPKGIGKYHDGKFTACSYLVFINKQPFATERVKLSMNGNLIGEFNVIDIEELNLVGRIKIML